MIAPPYRYTSTHPIPPRISGAGVIEILGSPSIVSTDTERREVWVYDKIATEFAYSNSGGGLSSFILGFPSDVLFGGSGGYNKNAGAASKSQRPLTIIIKFDDATRITFQQNGNRIIGTNQSRQDNAINGTRDGNTIKFKYWTQWREYTGTWKISPDGSRLDGSFENINGYGGKWVLTRI